jgi:nucleotide-binding universal stress UspA family protein
MSPAVTTRPRARPWPFTIVIGLKFTDGGAYAVDQAARMAQRIPGAGLHLLHVFETPLSNTDAEAMIDHLRLYASEKVKSLGGLGGRTMGIHVRSGDVARAVVQFATDVCAGLIVLGSDAPSIKAWLAPPTIETVIASAPCPVLVAGPKPLSPPVHDLAIDPVCPECVQNRFATEGRQWWCPRHSMHSLSAHTYSYQSELPYETYDSQLGPTGA